MNFEDFRTAVQAEFPLTYVEALVKDEVDDVLNAAIRRCLSKNEYIRSVELNGSQVIADCESIVKVVRTAFGTSQINVFDLMKTDRLNNSKVEWYFMSDTKQFIVRGESSVFVEYIATPESRTVDDLNSLYTEWAIQYAVALLKIKEGFLGTRAVLTALPFEFNYNEMREAGNTDKERLEEELEEMYFGCFSGK